MKNLAIFLAPLFGTILFSIFCEMVLLILKEFGHINFFSIIPIYISTLMFQIVIIEVLLWLISFYKKPNIKIYMILISTITFGASITWSLIYFILSDFEDSSFLLFSIGWFFFFFTYSIGNVFTYNYLYFKNQN
jgi:hypothetical protein